MCDSVQVFGIGHASNDILLYSTVKSTARFTHVFGFFYFLYGILFYKNIFLFSISKKNKLTIIPCPVCTCTYGLIQYLCISDRQKFNWVPSRAPPRNTKLVNGFSYICLSKTSEKTLHNKNIIIV